jgi:hypothetical protein
MWHPAQHSKLGELGELGNLYEHPQPHPLLDIRGMTAGQLTAMVDFIYNGKAIINQEDLDGSWTGSSLWQGTSG